MEKLIADQRLRESMGAKSRELFLRNFTDEKMARMVEKAMKLLSANASARKTNI